MRKLIVLAVAAMFTLVACNNTSNEETNGNLDDFESWVSDLETKVENGSVESWEEVEAEYQEAKNELTAEGKELDAEAEERWNELETRYEEAKADYQSWMNEQEMKAEESKNDFQAFMNSLPERTEEGMEDVGQEFDEVWADVEKNWDYYTDEAQAEMNEWKEDFNSWMDETFDGDDNDDMDS